MDFKNSKGKYILTKTGVMGIVTEVTDGGLQIVPLYYVHPLYQDLADFMLKNSVKAM